MPLDSLIHHSLELGGLTYRDLELPGFILPRDSFRLNLIDSLFLNPLKAIDYLRTWNDLTKNDGTKFSNKWASLCEILEIKGCDKPFTRGSWIRWSPVVIGQYFSNPKKIINNRNPGFLYWLGPILRIANSVENEKKTWDKKSFEYVVSLSDSMLLDDEDSSEMNIYEMKKEQLKSREKTREFLSHVSNLNYFEITRLGVLLSGYLSRSFGSEAVNFNNYKWGDKVLEFNSIYGKIAFGTRKDDVYHGNYFLIIEPGGDDIYIQSPRSKKEKSGQPVEIIIDLAGDDTYTGKDYSLGSGYFGISVIIDKNGNDNYTGGHFSVGSGYFGFGAIIDEMGNDSYSNQSGGIGFGGFGMGIISDMEGVDVYRSYNYAQGFGFTHGIGVLKDLSGNDRYITSSPYSDILRSESHSITFSQGAALGLRPLASGGVGLLLDSAGNDIYISDVFGQGSAYWFGFGGLYDENGDDKYSAYQYAQGAGIHFAHGILLDKQGDDSYNSHGVSLGCGHDIGFGAIIDEGGNDNYLSYGLSMGGGNANGLSLLVDVKGADFYAIRTENNSYGYSDWRRDYGMLGIFIDGAGTDKYIQTANNGVSKIKATTGFFWDLEDVKIITTDIKNTTVKQDLDPNGKLKKRKKVELTSTLDSLFIQASAAPDKYRHNVEPAKNSTLKKRRYCLRIPQNMN